MHVAPCLGRYAAPTERKRHICAPASGGRSGGVEAAVVLQGQWPLTKEHNNDKGFIIPGICHSAYLHWPHDCLHVHRFVVCCQYKVVQCFYNEAMVSLLLGFDKGPAHPCHISATC